nr:site-specific DNA-methyltransferase [Methanobrevibacter smithii]
MGSKLTTNTETSGRYHSNWLNMMYSRLKLARNLLKDDGILLISIDENEISNLTKVCSEIFGEENIIGTFIWNNRTTPNDAKNNFAIDHEYILIVAKIADLIYFNGVEKDLSNYKNPDNDINGPWMKDNPSAASGSEKDRFVIKNPFTGQEYLPPTGRYWGFSKKRVEEWFNSGKLVFPKQKNKNFILKKYVSELRSNFKPQSSLLSGILTMHGTKEIRNIFFDGQNIFKYPKPSILIIELLNQFSLENSIILDFFSGSATTAHATMQLNSEDNGKRKFIMVQIPELTDEKSEAYKAGYKNICEIGKERIRRAGDKILEESTNKDLDIGFKVFKLDSSNLEKWDPDYDNLEQTLLTNKENIKPDRTELDLIYEIMLKYGIDLTLPIEKINNIYSIGYGALLICLEDNITKEIAEEIIKIKSDNITRVVFKESGFKSDADKTNIKENLRINNINEFITI